MPKALRCANKIHALRKPDRTKVCPYVSVAFFFKIGIALEKEAILSVQKYFGKVINLCLESWIMDGHYYKCRFIYLQKNN